MTAPQRIEAAIASLEALVAKHYDVVHGSNTSTVPTDAGPVPSLSKKLNDIGAQIVTGFESGWTIVVANAAGRAAAQAGAAHQALWQVDTQTLYISNSTSAGDFAIHPLQAAIASPAAAVAAVSSTLAVVQAWIAAVDPGNDHVVESAAAVAVMAAATAPAPDTLKVYGKNSSGDLGAHIVPLPRFYETFTSLTNAEPTAVMRNPGRLCLSDGAVGGITSSGRVILWGNQASAGQYGRGSLFVGSHPASEMVLSNNVVRPLPSFSPHLRKISRVIHTRATSHALLDDGTVCACGPALAGVWDIYGSDSGVAQHTLQACYFNASGTNKSMVKIDTAVPTYTASNNSGFASIDTDGNVWIMTNNPGAIGYSGALTSAQRIPVNVTPGVSGWSGKTAVDVRTTIFGGVLVLMSDGTLWAASHVNSTGFLGLGSTSTLANFTQIATGVNHFEIGGDYNDSCMALFILQGTTLKGAGYNAEGVMGQGDTVNKTSFVTIGTDIVKVRIGGERTLSLLCQKSDGSMHGVGFNTTGALGSGADVNLTTLTSLTALNAIVSSGGGAVDFMTSGTGTTASSTVILSNGQAYATGSNSLGQLAVGDFTNRNLWSRVLWSALPGEKIVQAQPYSSSEGHFVYLTNLGRILVGGRDSNIGLTTGVPGTFNANRSTLNHVRI